MANKPNALPALPLLVQFLDARTGLVSPPWAAYFRELDKRVGGRIGSSTTTLADLITALQTNFATAETDLDGIGQGRVL